MRITTTIFNNVYLGISIGGYHIIIDSLLEEMDTKTGVDFFADKVALKSLVDKVIYTGEIDEFFDYKYGQLEYRSLKFEHKLYTIQSYQGNAS